MLSGYKDNHDVRIEDNLTTSSCIGIGKANHRNYSVLFFSCNHQVEFHSYCSAGRIGQKEPSGKISSTCYLNAAKNGNDRHTQDTRSADLQEF